MRSSRNQRPWFFCNTIAKWRGPKLVLGYWSIRGLAEPLRTLLEYCGLPYVEVNAKSYEDRDAIRVDKRYDFPNLPYLRTFEGKFLTES